MSLAHIRRNYLGEPLSESESDSDPFAQFAKWFEQAQATETDPTAMAVATATRGGRPSVRTVLLKGFDARGFVFYTNYNSRKGREIAETGRASLLFLWRSVNRQVRIDGTVEKTSESESDAYFGTRPIESCLSVYASRQSEPVESRAALDALFEEAKQTYASVPVPRPSWWGGYRIIPEEFEFWQGRENRLHDRLHYTRQPDGSWRRQRLAP